MKNMKAEITSSSGARHGYDPQEVIFNTLEELRDFILSTQHSIIVWVHKDEPDTLDIEIYDEWRE